MFNRSEIPKDYDGFYFLPPDSENEEGFIFHFFKLREELSDGKPIDNSKMGDMFHVCFFKRGDSGKPEFDDAFEAIFIDPLTYVSETLMGAEIYGCFCRKTDKSETWFQDYLTKVIGHVMIKKLSSYAKSIADT